MRAALARVRVARILLPIRQAVPAGLMGTYCAGSSCAASEDEEGDLPQVVAALLGNR